MWELNEQRAKYLLYKDYVKKRTEQNVKRFYVENIELRGRKHGYQLDHKYSIRQGFDDGMPPDMIAHPCNLICVPTEYNLKKGSKNSITFEELLEDINDHDNL